MNAELSSDRYLHSSLALPDGRVLVAGGYKITGTEQMDDDHGGTFPVSVDVGLEEIEVLDSQTLQPQPFPRMSHWRLQPGLHLLSDCEVAIVGGGAMEELSTSPDLEIAHLAERRFLPVPSLPATYRMSNDAVVLPNGALACICYDDSYESKLDHLAVLSPSRTSWRMMEVPFRKHQRRTGSLVLTRDGGSLVLVDLVGTPILVESSNPGVRAPCVHSRENCWLTLLHTCLAIVFSSGATSSRRSTAMATIQVTVSLRRRSITGATRGPYVKKGLSPGWVPP